MANQIEFFELNTRAKIPSDGLGKAMEALYGSGKARAIGVSNFSTKKLSDLVEVARVPPSVNQVECHPSWQQYKLHEFCKCPKGSTCQDIRHLVLQEQRGVKGDVLKSPVLEMVAKELGKSPAQTPL